MPQLLSLQTARARPWTSRLTWWPTRATWVTGNVQRQNVQALALSKLVSKASLSAHNWLTQF